MLKMCQETLMKPKEIFDTVCRRYPVAAVHVSYSTVRNFLNREQLRQRPETPQTIVELDVVLKNYPPVQYIFKGIILSDDGYRAVIFASDALLDLLVSTTEIYMDGTFKVSNVISYYLTRAGAKKREAKYVKIHNCSKNIFLYSGSSSNAIICAVIYIQYMDTGIAVLFALCEKHTTEMCSAIWRKVKELRPNALQEVRSVMSDYERVAMIERFFQMHD